MVILLRRFTLGRCPRLTATFRAAPTLSALLYFSTTPFLLVLCRPNSIEKVDWLRFGIDNPSFRNRIRKAPADYRRHPRRKSSSFLGLERNLAVGNFSKNTSTKTNNQHSGNGTPETTTTGFIPPCPTPAPPKGIKGVGGIAQRKQLIHGSIHAAIHEFMSLLIDSCINA